MHGELFYVEIFNYINIVFGSVVILNCFMFQGTTEHSHRSEQGHNLAFATNYLAHFHLTNLLLDLMKRSGGARIVNVASCAHYSAEMNLECVQKYGGDYYPGLKTYAVSKMGNILHSQHLAKNLKGNQCLINQILIYKYKYFFYN